MHKLITSIRDSDDLSIRIDRDRGRRQRKLTKNKTEKSQFHFRIHLKDIFGFAEHHEKATYGLRFKLPLT